MDIRSLKEFCLSFPHSTEDVKWENDLCFSVGGKVFCIGSLKDEQAANARVSFKCTPEKYAELVELDGIEPAPHVAQYHWVAVKEPSVLEDDDYEDLITKSYMLVLDKLSEDVKKSL